MPLFLVLWLSGLLISCSTTLSTMRPAGAQQKINITTRERSQGSGSIKLLDHQLVPIDYLIKNPDIKGLLVNHYMNR